MSLPALEYWWMVPLAFAVDLLWGDPPLPWRHPVCWVGGLLARLEGLGRGLGTLCGRKLGNTRLAGALCLAMLLAATGTVVYMAVSLPFVGAWLALYAAYAGLSSGSLLRTFDEVLEAVEEAPLPQARQALSRLVSRDTSDMDRDVLRKSLADTLAENITDAVVAPLFWLLFTGPVGLWMYKAVSTTDSMWGYKTERWLLLGWAGARADDVLAYIPARLAVFFLWLGHGMDIVLQRPCAQGGRWPGWAVIASQAGGMESPNSGWPMAAGAWLLGARMGGPTPYFGQWVHKPWVGPPQEEAHSWDRARLQALSCAARRVALLSFVCLYGCAVLWACLLG